MATGILVLNALVCKGIKNFYMKLFKKKSKN